MLFFGISLYTVAFFPQNTMPQLATMATVVYSTMEGMFVNVRYIYMLRFSSMHSKQESITNTYTHSDPDIRTTLRQHSFGDYRFCGS